jgi:hypothetical protein
LCIVLIIPAGYHLVIGRAARNQPTGTQRTEVHHIKPGTTPMKTLIASSVIALSLFATAASALPYDSNVPQWAQKAFTGADK